MFRIPLYANRLTLLLLPIVIGMAYGTMHKAGQTNGTLKIPKMARSIETIGAGLSFKGIG